MYTTAERAREIELARVAVRTTVWPDKTAEASVLTDVSLERVVEFDRRSTGDYPSLHMFDVTLAPVEKSDARK